MSAGPGTSGPLRIGVIGCGVIAYWSHLRILRRLPGAQLVAAADPDPLARRRAHQLTRVPMHESTDELLARADLDAVIISSPTADHARSALAAAQAGKHFYLEKPIAAEVSDARAVVSAATGNGVIGRLGFNRRCHPVFEQARSLLSAGSIGPVLNVQSVLTEPVELDTMAAWRRSRAQGGGVLLDLASHHLDLLRWLLKCEIREVLGRTQTASSEQDSAWLRMTMGAGVDSAVEGHVVGGVAAGVDSDSKTGVEITSYFSYRAARADTIEIIGENGILRLDRHRTMISLRRARRFGYGVRSAMVMPSRAALSWRMARLLRPSLESSYRRALSSFVAACRGEPDELATLVDGLRNLETIEAAERSAALGHAVRLEPQSN